MKKNKVMLFSPALLMCFVVITVIASNRLGNKNVFATANETWHHYAAVTPTENMHGSKEFWAKESENCSISYFENPGVECIENDFSTYDYFENLPFYDERYVPSLFEQRNAVYPKVDSENNTITYGIYPQTVVDDSDLLTSLNALDDSAINSNNGWYLYNGCYYTKVSASPYQSNYVFNNGTIISNKTTYWFTCEPIIWNILSNNNGDYFILSSMLLDTYFYYDYPTSNRTIDGQTVYANNYKYSDIRAWLNDNFYNSAFSLGNYYIQTTTVDNSASSTSSSNNTYACDNTEDKVFLPSIRELSLVSYGFSSIASRCCKPTDWARAKYASYYTSSGSYQYNGNYWTRSPSNRAFDFASYVDTSGNITEGEGYVYAVDRCVRPAIVIEIM